MKHQYYKIMNIPLDEQIDPRCLILMTNKKDSITIKRNTLVPLTKEKIKISFSTYFGAFHIEPWKNFTNIKDIIFSFTLKGKGILRIKYINSFGEEAVILEKEFSYSEPSNEIVSINLENLQNIGIIYPEFIFTENSDWLLRDLAYLTSKKPEQDITLALIMTTFKKENFVYTNINNLKRVLSDKINLIIIDNGQSIKLTESSPYIKIYYNPNYGGTGGFTRGLLEVLKNGKYSHIVLMDDDIVVYPETILRTLKFFEYAQSPIVIGGAMLNLSQKEIINECGALYKNLSITLLKHNLNICNSKHLLKYTDPEYIGYFGWWFFGLPVKVIQKVQLPFPFFIRGDDIEYSYRLRKIYPHINFVSLLGVGVWHEEFYKKDNPVIDYYINRNGLIFSILYEREKFNKSIKKVLLSIIKNLLLYKYERVKYILLGIEDFLKGPNFLKSINPEEYHNYLQSIQSVKPQNFKEIFLSYKYKRKIRFPKLKKLLSFITLNGHILPNILIQEGKKPEDDGFIFEPLHSNRVEAIFLKETVIFYEPTKGIGLKYKHSKKLFFKYLFKAIILIIKLFFNQKSLHTKYEKEFKYLTSPDFWKKYLKLDT